MKDDPLYANTTVLAFLGDAAYELRIRAHVVRAGIADADRLHRAAVRYVRAAAQATAMKALFPALPVEEQTLAKRARNKKISAKPKNADPIDYKWATAFEALLGYYSMLGQHEKIDAATAAAIRIIDAASVETTARRGGEV
jgi:ribonuclease-3 family protein